MSGKTTLWILSAVILILGCSVIMNYILNNHANLSDEESERLSVSSKARFKQILSRQTKRYPALTPQDLYKLIYQAAMGSAHAITDVKTASDWLNNEIANLTPGPNEPMVDAISPDSEIVRINLRPYIAAGGDKAKLLDAFVKTANEYKGSEKKLRQYWLYAERMAQNGQLPFAKKDMQDYFSEMEIQGLPAVHHSEGYEKAYKPAYRVIARNLLDLTDLVKQ